MNLIELCRQAIAIDSTPLHGNKEIIQWAADLALQRGFHIEVQSEYQGGLEQQNLIIRPQQGRCDSEFLFQNHLDTVDPGPYQLWKENFQNPFEATIKDGKIYGLGAADGKVDFICKLEALTNYLSSPRWILPPVLVVTAGAHLGMIGALKLIRKNKISSKMAMIGEPTDMQIVNAAPGSATFEIRAFFSKEELKCHEEHNSRESTSTQSKLFSGNKSQTHSLQEENAIRKMLESLSQLPENIVVLEVDGGSNSNTTPANAFLEIELEITSEPISKKLISIYQFIKNLELEFQTYQDPDFTPPCPTLNIGMIRTIEDQVLILGSCHLPPLISQPVYEDWMSRITAHCESLGVSFRVSNYNKPFRTEESSALVRGSLSELHKLQPIARASCQNSVNEASLFSRVGIECVCFGPGQKENNLYTPQEFVAVKDIDIAVAFYKNIIERFCL